MQVLAGMTPVRAWADFAFERVLLNDPDDIGEGPWASVTIKCQNGGCAMRLKKFLCINFQWRDQCAHSTRDQAWSHKIAGRCCELSSDQFQRKAL